jgi:hypothetical protein
MVERLTYRVSEFCEAVGIERTKFYALVGNGAIKAVRLDGMTMVTGPEAERFIAALPLVLPKRSNSEDGQPVRGNEDPVRNQKATTSAMHGSVLRSTKTVRDETHGFASSVRTTAAENSPDRV